LYLLHVIETYLTAAVKVLKVVKKYLIERLYFFFGQVLLKFELASRCRKSLCFEIFGNKVLKILLSQNIFFFVIYIKDVSQINNILFVNSGIGRLIE
jgi:hypothetical protein